jgi:hypothetical protein
MFNYVGTTEKLGEHFVVKCDVYRGHQSHVNLTNVNV